MKKLILATLLFAGQMAAAEIKCTAIDNLSNKAAKADFFKEGKEKTITRLSSATEINGSSLFNAVVIAENNKISINGGINGESSLETSSSLQIGQSIDLTIKASGSAGPVPLMTVSCKNVQ